MAPQTLKIIEDCTRLVNTTENPDVFFNRYDLLIEKAQDLVGYAKYVKFKGMQPQKILEQAIEKRSASTADFIKRYHSRIMTEAAEKKTKKGKRSQIDKFYASLQPYYHSMAQDCIDLVEQMHAEDIAE